MIRYRPLITGLMIIGLASTEPSPDVNSNPYLLNGFADDVNRFFGNQETSNSDTDHLSKNVFLQHMIAARAINSFAAPEYLPPLVCSGGQTCVRKDICLNGYFSQSISTSKRECDEKSEVCCTYRPQQQTPSPRPSQPTPPPSTPCTGNDFTCVNPTQCINGVVKSNELFKPGGPKTSRCYAPEVCCRQPEPSTLLKDDGYVLRVPENPYTPQRQSPATPTRQYTAQPTQQQTTRYSQPSNGYIPPSQGSSTRYQPQPTQTSYSQQPTSPRYSPRPTASQVFTTQTTQYTQQPTYRPQPQPSNNQGYTRRPAPQPTYNPQPTVTQGYRSQPTVTQGYRPQPTVTQGYRAQSTAATQGYRPQPTATQGYRSQPTTQGYRPQPTATQGYRPQPTAGQTYLPPQRQSRPQPTSRPQTYSSQQTSRPQPSRTQGYTPQQTTRLQQTQRTTFEGYSSRTPAPQTYNPQPSATQTYTAQTTQRYKPQTQPQPTQGYQYSPQPSTSQTYRSQSPAQTYRPQTRPQQKYTPAATSPQRYTPQASSQYLPPVSSTFAPLQPDRLPDASIPTANRVPPIRGEGVLSQPIRPPPGNSILSEIMIPTKCPAAMNCTDIQFCSATGVISKTPIVLSPEQQAYRVPLTDCRDTAKGIVGKCCRDPDYTDPWPVSQLGQYNPEIFGDKGKYQPQKNGGGAQRNQIAQPSSISGQAVLSEPIYPGRQYIPPVSNNLSKRQSQCATRKLNPLLPGYGPLDAGFAEYPWQVMVLQESTKSLLCGGAIIADDIALTSAHCVAGNKPHNILVKAGEWKLGRDEEPLPFQLVRVRSIQLHPRYEAASLKHDIALLHLDIKFKMDEHVAPICIDDTDPEPNEECVTTGWGKEALRLHAQDAIMHHSRVSILSAIECKQQNSAICGKPSIDSCELDVGSALACTNGNGPYILKGVYSAEDECGPNGVVSFTRPDLSWINSAKAIRQARKF